MPNRYGFRIGVDGPRFLRAEESLLSHFNVTGQDAGFSRTWGLVNQPSGTFSIANPAPATLAYSGGSFSWPNNEPAGMTMITSTDGSDKWFGVEGSLSGTLNDGNTRSGAGWFFGGRWNDDTFVEGNVAHSGSPYGTVIEKRFFIGDLDGWNGIAQYDWLGTVGRRRHCYFRTIFKYSANWQIYGNNEKPYGYLAFQGGLNDLYMSMEPSGLWKLFNQAIAPNDEWSTGFTMTRDQWITLEMYVVGETTPGTNDGEIYIWINDTLVNSETGLSWSPTANSHWRGASLFLYWGGGPPPVITKQVNDWVTIGEIYISGKN